MSLPCCCLREEGLPPRRSLACPDHGCTCGTGRSGPLAHRAARDGSCPTHGAPAATAPTGSAPTLPPLDPAALAPVDVAILANELRTFKYQGAKEMECARIMGGSRPGAPRPVTRYYQRLNRLLDHPAADAAQPALVTRLRAQRKDH